MRNKNSSLQSFLCPIAAMFVLWYMLVFSILSFCPCFYFVKPFIKLNFRKILDGLSILNLNTIICICFCTMSKDLVNPHIENGENTS